MGATVANILIVEDDAEIAELLEENLNALGFGTRAVDNGQAMFDELASGSHDLILLDIMLPGEDGLALCRKLRTPGSAHEHIPVIFLSALGELTDRVVGLEIGADDYLPKPFAIRELVARIRALLRRTRSKTGSDSPQPGAGRAGEGSDPGTLWSFGPWQVNIGARHLVDQDGVTIPLSAVEFRLLLLFLQNPQQILSRESILQHMADRSDSYDRSIDVQVSRLRAKLRDSGRNPTLIRTMRGDGYMLAVPVDRGEKA